MAFAPLQLKGNKKINDTDVSAQIMSFTVKGSRATVTIPKTFGSRSSVRGGDDTYEVEIAFLQDVDATAISEIFWAALADDEGTITFAATVRDDAVSATNPEYTGVALVTGWELGGDVDAVGQQTVTLPLLDRPTRSTGA